MDTTREQVPPADTLALLGGHVALDFANTADWHASEEPRERLLSYVDLVRWSRHAGLLTASDVRLLERAAAASPRRAERVLRQTVTLREALYRVATAAAAREAAARDDLAHLNRAAADALAHASLEQTADAFVVRWPAADSPDALEVPLWRLAHAIGELLTSGDVLRLRQCEGERCGWLFLDRSRNRSRRWCSSADCGNRARVREHLARRRAARG